MLGAKQRKLRFQRQKNVVFHYSNNVCKTIRLNNVLHYTILHRESLFREFNRYAYWNL